MVLENKTTNENPKGLTPEEKTSLLIIRDRSKDNQGFRKITDIKHLGSVLFYPEDVVAVENILHQHNISEQDICKWFSGEITLNDLKITPKNS